MLTPSALSYYQVTAGNQRVTLILFAEPKENGKDDYYLTANGQRIRPVEGEEVCTAQKAREWFKGVLSLYMTKMGYLVSIHGSSLN